MAFAGLAGGTIYPSSGFTMQSQKVSGMSTVDYGGSLLPTFQQPFALAIGALISSDLMAM